MCTICWQDLGLASILFLFPSPDPSLLSAFHNSPFICCVQYTAGGKIHDISCACDVTFCIKGGSGDMIGKGILLLNMLMKCELHLKLHHGPSTRTGNATLEMTAADACNTSVPWGQQYNQRPTGLHCLSSREPLIRVINLVPLMRWSNVSQTPLLRVTGRENRVA